MMYKETVNKLHVEDTLCARFLQIFHNSKLSEESVIFFYLKPDVSPYLFLFGCSLYNYEEC